MTEVSVSSIPESTAALLREDFPSLSPSVLVKRAEFIRPVIRAKGSLWIVTQRDLHRANILLGTRTLLEAEIEEIARVRMYFEWNRGEPFTPTLAEALTQVPNPYLGATRYFELGGNMQSHGGYVSVEVVLYKDNAAD